MKKGREYLFSDAPVFEAILQLALPTIIGQIILIIYNMADTFFIGLTGSDAMLTAVTVCMPAFMFLSAISNLFGIGGGAVISRALGKNNRNRAVNASAYALYGCILAAVLYGAGVLLLKDGYVNILGGSQPLVHMYAAEYLTVTVIIGGVFTAVSTLLSHLIRSEGRSMKASFGIAMGGILNIILDPLFMFLILPKGREALGAAIATALSNVISCIYFILVIYRLQKEKSTVLSFRFAHDALIDGSAKEILLNGLPACLMTLFENVSYAVLDHLMAFSGMEAQAGLGVAKKINMLAHCMVRGMSQGVLPLIAFNYSAGNYRRMKDTIRVSAGMSVLLSLVTLVLCFTFSRQLIGIFIRSESMSLAYGTRFLRILCLGCPFSAFAYAIISFFQAVGKSGRSFVLAVCRKGALDIPMMFVLFRSLSVRGVVWATPITDIICCTAAFMLYRNALKNMKISLWNKDLNSEIRADDTILLQRNAKHA